jgi:hypothetical protein
MILFHSSLIPLQLAGLSMMPMLGGDLLAGARLVNAACNDLGLR